MSGLDTGVDVGVSALAIERTEEYWKLLFVLSNGRRRVSCVEVSGTGVRVWLLDIN